MPSFGASDIKGIRMCSKEETSAVRRISFRDMRLVVAFFVDCFLITVRVDDLQRQNDFRVF
jgi:hypothetical protein